MKAEVRNLQHGDLFEAESMIQAAQVLERARGEEEVETSSQ